MGFSYRDTDLETPEDQRTCPRRPFKDRPEWHNSIIEAWNYMDSGYLMHVGGVVDQPALLMEAMSVVSAAVSDGRDELHKAERRRAEADRQARAMAGKGM